ncbi:hypothetical protein SOVF_052310 [Spinacia oleracea]|nr:hypothetical protein SOVF_052310 [Spinacia oleracea]
MLQDSNGPGKDQNSELDIQPSEEANTSSGENLRASKTFNSSMEDVDNGSNTADTNPCVAGIDLSFDDHGCTSLSPSYSNNAWHEASKEDDHCDSRRNRDLRRSPLDSKKKSHQVEKVDYHRSRNKRDDKKVKESGGRYHIRVRNSTEEDLKHNDRRVRRNLYSESHSGKDNENRIGTADRKYGVVRSRAEHRRSDEWCLTSASDDEYWCSYRENESSFGCYDKRLTENRFQEKGKRKFDRRDHWGSRGEVDLNSQREWDEEQWFSDRRMRRMRRMRGVIVQNDWHLQERECLIRDEKPSFRNQQHLLSEFSSSHEFNLFEQQREYDEPHFDGKSKHYRSLQYRYSDGTEHNRYMRSSPLDDRQSKYLDSEIRHERHRWHPGVEVATSGREDEYFESPFDVDYPRYHDVDECRNGKTSTSTHDYQDEFRTYGERRHHHILCRDDMDDPQMYQRYERHSRSVLADKGTDSRQIYDHSDFYNRQEAAKYLDEDDYVEERQNAFQSKGCSGAEDTLFDERFDDDLCGVNIDSFEVIPRHKWHGVMHNNVPGRMTMHSQMMKGRLAVASDVGGKYYSKMSTKGKHEENGLWGRNSLEMHNTVRKRKSTGVFSKAGRSLPNDDACVHVAGRFQKQCKRQQEISEAFPENKMENKAVNTEALPDKLPFINHQGNAADLEDGQIPTEQPKTEFVKVKRDIMNETIPHSQKLKSQNGGCAYDESRILETKAKMEKRRERFKEPCKEPMLVKEDKDCDSKPEVDKLVETTESKGLRPARKRKWG